ncbi:uncharacterized protein [Lepeophtheirus salmonis]|uniref:uncharacterized protein isoform X2 n=1 Tax=Lepeophtheirus salmonis TaxID=72036 RepID=UPI001AE81706|nr:uncharacterized protein LOC121122152 [Lepeophtheirus salmonis]
MIEGGTAIDFKPCDIRPINTELNDVSQFFGSVLLLSTVQRNFRPDFKLRGKTAFCPEQNISFKVVDIKGMKSGNLICRITDRKGNSVHKKLDEFTVEFDSLESKTKITKDKKREKKGKAKKSTITTQKKFKLYIDHEHLKVGQTYKLEVTGERIYRSGSSIKTDMKTVTFSIMDKNSPISLSIIGPTYPIPANRPLKLKGKLKSCKKNSSFRKEYKDVKYSWTSQPSIPMIKKSKNSNKKLKIKNGLIGGKVYTFNLKIEAKPKNSSLPPFEMSTSLIVETLILGPKAFIPIDKITFGVENDITLDGDGSLDQDNTNEDLKFEWFCEKDSVDKGCFVSHINQKGVPVLLKQHLPKEVMKRHRLIIPKHTLLPGIYNFFLEAKLERVGKISRRSVLVEVVLGKVGSMEFARFNNIIDVSKPTIIKALIRNTNDICLKWECEIEKGYAFIDLKAVSKHGELKCFQTMKSERMFNLVIRPNSLISGAEYKFRLIQKNQEYGTIASATIKLSTHEYTRIPIFKIYPSEGLAMTTKFSLEFVDLPTEIADNELKYTFRLFYGSDQNERIYLNNGIFEEFELPASDEHLYVFLQMCDEFEVCQMIGSDNSVEIVLASEFGMERIKLLKEIAVEAQNEGECLFSMSYLYRTIATLREEKPLYDAHYQEICTLLYAIFLDCSNTFSQEIKQNREYYSITIAMELFLASDCFSNKSDDTIMRDEKSDGNIGLNVEKRAIQSINKIRNIILDTTLEDISLTDENESTKRQKRETKDTIISEKMPLLKLLSRSLTNEQMQVLIAWTTNSLKNSNDAKTEFGQFLDQIVLKYMKAICKTTYSQSDVETINTNDVDMSVLSKDFSEKSTHSVISNISSLDSIKFEDAMITKLKEWKCSDIVTCSGLTIGAIKINSDMVVTDKTLKEAPKIISSVFGVHLLNPYTCETIAFENEDFFQMSVEVNEFSEVQKIKQERSFQMQCMVLIDGKWDMKSCETEGFSYKNQDSAVVYCKCSKSGYVAIGMVDSDNEVVVIQQSFAYHKDVQFRILDKYDKELDDNDLNVFKTSLLDRLQKTVGIKPSEVKNLAVMKGPKGELMVKFELVSEEEVDSIRLKNSHSELRDLIEAGTFKMKGLNGNPVAVPAQCIGDCVTKKHTEKQNYLILIIIASVVVAFLIFISICILCAVQSKKRRLDEKVKPFPSNTEIAPNYRTLQYANSLQGTVSSMKRIKEDKLKNELKKSIDENVLPPAAYETPTPELSHRIKSVSPEMVANMTRHLELPGTPENK